MSSDARPIAAQRVAFDALLAATEEDRDALFAQLTRGDDAFAHTLRALLEAEARGGERAGIPNPLHDPALAGALGLVEPGARIGDYEITALIGRGGMGRVYRARSRIDGHEVAIKLVRPELFDDALRRRFSNERGLLAALVHPGICRFIDGGELADGTPYVVMELVDGEPLLAHCDRLALGLRERIALFRRVLDAVAHAHHHLVVHRDIKSDNLMVDVQGQPRLLDFGIAKSLAGDVAATRTADRFVTLAHAAPEQFGSGPVTVACDIYALGVLLYELLRGATPFALAGRTPAELQYAIEHVPPASLDAALPGDDAVAQARGFGAGAALRSALGGDLDAIVQQCLRKAPGERYATVEQLDEELARVLENRAVRARGGDRLYRMRKFVSRHRWSVGASALFVSGVVVALAVITAQNRHISMERDRAASALAILRDAFLGADPARVSGEHLTAREVLEDARPRLDAIEAEQPEVFVALGTTIAEVEAGLGLSERAGELSRRVLASIETHGLSSGDTAQAYLLDARVRGNLGELSAAEISLQRAIALGGESARTWAVLGDLRLKRDDFDGASALLTRAVAASEHAAPDDDWANYSRRRLVELHRLRREDAAALAVVEASLARLQAGFGDAHPLVMAWQLIRAQSLLRLGRSDEAQVQAEQLRARLREGRGSRNALMAETETVLGAIHYDARRWPQAIDAFAHAHEVWLEIGGQAHPNALRIGFNLAAARLATEPVPQAETLALFRSLLAGGVRRFGAESSAAHRFLAGYLRAASDAEDRTLPLRVLASADAAAVFAAVSQERRDQLRPAIAQALERGGCEPAGRHRGELCQNANRLLGQAGSAP